MRLTTIFPLAVVLSGCTPFFKEEPKEPPAFPIFECDGTTLIETTGVETSENGTAISAQAITRNSPQCM